MQDTSADIYFSPISLERLPEAPINPLGIDLWWLPLDIATSHVPSLERLLSADERQRAACFRFERDYRRYVVGRGLLRRLLSLYIGMRPEDIPFVYGPKGKPELATASHPALYFNLSHSADRMLFGVTTVGPLGVDVEQVQDLPDIEQIARQFFSRSEQAELKQAVPPDKPTAFFNCWTRKEAYLKAIGDGLSVPLDRFTVTLAPGEPARIVAMEGDDASAWTLRHLLPEAGFIGALAMRYPCSRVQAWELTVAPE